MFQSRVLIIRRSKLYFTASGIITRIGGCLVHQTATYICDDTRGCVMQFWPPDDEHMCSKNVEAWNKLNVNQKRSASSWLITEKITLIYCLEPATYRCDDSRGCVMQFWPDDEHMCSKHVEAWNKLFLKQHFLHQVG